jgi:tetratricopeptide (TPR) repeat protein
MSQKNENFIDKTFTIIADVLLKTFPASKQEKQAFFYYREGLAAQCAGEYAEALENYYEALQIEEDPYDRSYILYNIGLLYTRYIYIYYKYLYLIQKN